MVFLTQLIQIMISYNPCCLFTAVAAYYLLWVCRTVQLYMDKLPLLQQPCCINLVNICKMWQPFKYTILNANCIDPFGKTVE